MLFDILHTVAKLQGNLQAKEIAIPGTLTRSDTIMAKKKIRILIDFYGIFAERAYFDGDEAFSEPDIDREAGWKLFQRLIFRKYREFLANRAFLFDRQ